MLPTLSLSYHAVEKARSAFAAPEGEETTGQKAGRLAGRAAVNVGLTIGALVELIVLLPFNVIAGIFSDSPLKHNRTYCIVMKSASATVLALCNAFRGIIGADPIKLNDFLPLYIRLMDLEPMERKVFVAERLVKAYETLIERDEAEIAKLNAKQPNLQRKLAEAQTQLAQARQELEAQPDRNESQPLLDTGTSDSN